MLPFRGSDRIEARDTRQLCMADTACWHVDEVIYRSVHSDMLNHRSGAADGITHQQRTQTKAVRSSGAA